MGPSAPTCSKRGSSPKAKMSTTPADSTTTLVAGRITIVVLSHNRPQLRERALRSIQQQTYPARDVIVIDNASASSDRVRAVVAACASVRLIANATNLGFTGGMNQGLD